MFKVLDEDCIPTKGSKFSTCIDLRASEDVVIGAGETKMVGLGVCIDDRKLSNKIWNTYTMTPETLSRKTSEFKKSHYLQLMLRSSLGKKGLILPNGVGVIDMDYRDEIKMIIHKPLTIQDIYAHITFFVKKFIPTSISKEAPNNATRFTIKKGDRIAQITLLEHKVNMFDIDTNDERVGGFGSTGK